MKIHHTTALGVCDTYEVVTEPPLGYIIWNIGDNAPEGYLRSADSNLCSRLRADAKLSRIP